MGACALIKVADSFVPISHVGPLPTSNPNENRISEQVLSQLSGLVSGSAQEQILLLKRQVESQQEQIETFKHVLVLEQQKNDLEWRLSSSGQTSEENVSNTLKHSIRSDSKHDKGRENVNMARVRVGSVDMESTESEKGFNSETVSRGIELFFLRQDEKKVKEVFEKLCSSISRDGRKRADGHAARNAMEKLGMEMKNLNADTLTAFLDTDGDKFVSFEEFNSALKSPSKIERWTSTIPWNQLAAAVLNCCLVHRDEDPLRRICSLSQQEAASIHKGLSDGFTRLLNEHIQQLKTAFTEMDNQHIAHMAGEQQNKFSMTRDMQCGTVSSFYDGLSQRIGSPNLDFKKGMEKEHYCDKPFKTQTYQIETSPIKEWRYVVKQEKIPGDEMVGRRIRDIDELLNLDKKKPTNIRANLRAEEIIAIILYTGPMYTHYNLVLRKWPTKEFENLNGNTYATTIHCLVSGITKISKVTKINENLKFYRGFGGVRLPDCFFKPPEGELYKGIVEWGFMSTSSNKAVAIQYTGISKGLSFPTILQIQPAAVDHGADVSDFSQYPDEREYLWNPCSLIEANDDSFIEVTEEGIVTIIPVRMNNNVKTMTLEELLEQKKRMHISSFEIILNEIKDDLDRMAEALKEKDAQEKGKGVKGQSQENGTEHQKLVQFFIEGIVIECKSKLEQHRRVYPEDYAKDTEFQKLVMEMLETKTSALSKKALCQGALKQLRTGRNVLMLVAEKGDCMRTKELIDADQTLVSECAQETKKTALHIAAKRGFLEVVKALVDRGADKDAQDKNGKTPLHYAAENRHPGVICFLLDAKADASIKADNKTPLDLLLPMESKSEEAKEGGHASEDENENDSENKEQDQFLSDLDVRARKCKNEFIWRGADGWTPLMVASEMGAFHVRNIVEIHNAVQLLKKAKVSPWLNHHAKEFFSEQLWRKKFWSWDKHDESAINLSEDTLTVSKFKDKPKNDFSCAIGSDEFSSSGTHIWEIQVGNVQSMWLGIARGVVERGGLNQMAGLDDSVAEYMIAYSNQGTIACVGRQPIIHEIDEPPMKFCTGQTIHFKLNMKMCELTVQIDGKIALVARDIDVSNVYPYVCMDFTESATLITTAYIPAESDLFSAEPSLTHFGTNENLDLQTPWSMELHDAIQEQLAKGLRAIKMGSGNLDTLRQLIKECKSQLLNTIPIKEIFALLLAYGTIDQTFARMTESRIFVELKHFAVTEDFNINCQDKSGNAPLHVAAYAGIIDSVCALLELKADTNQRNKIGGRTALHIATMKGHIAIVVMLLENGAQISQPDDKGQTPLDLAGASHSTKCIDTLKAYGADGWTPLLCASQGGLSKLEQCLKRTLHLKETLKCIEDGRSFIDQQSKWFILKMVRYKNYLDSKRWTWEGQESESFALSEDAMTIEKLQKSLGSSDISCALGNVEFHDGVHIWEMIVENAQSMCLGIAQGVSSDAHGFLDSRIKGDFKVILAFSCQGEPVMHGIRPEIDYVMKPPCYKAGQRLRLTLDLDARTLFLHIDGKEAVNASELAVEGPVCPYVCLTSRESVTIEHYESCRRMIKNLSNLESLKNSLGLSASVGEENLLAALDNRLWSKEQDSRLREMLTRAREIKGPENWSTDVLPTNTAIVDLIDRPEGTVKARLFVLATIKYLMRLIFGYDSFHRSSEVMANLDINVKSFKGQSALHISAIHGHHDSIKILAEQNILLDSVDAEGQTALHLAAINHQITVMNQLVECGATINAANRSGFTPLDLLNFEAKLAAKEGRDIKNVAIIESCQIALKRRGANGFTPIMICAAAGASSIQYYLKICPQLVEAKKCLATNSEVYMPWFQNKIEKYSQIQTALWAWSHTYFEVSSMVLDPNKLTVTKAKQFPDFSCALGSELLETGIHMWDVVVYNVQSMWLGVASGAERFLDVPLCGDYLVVFKNDGRCPFAQYQKSAEASKHQPLCTWYLMQHLNLGK